MTTKVDLQALAVDRNRSAQTALRRPRNWFTRLAIPAALLVGFAGLLAWSLRDWLLPATPVTVVVMPW